MHRHIARLTVAALALGACGPLDIPRDVMGNFEVQYDDNIRVYLNDELVAEARSGEDPEITHDGQIFRVSQLCGEEGTECPSDTYWDAVAIDQPWGEEYSLLNFVNLDPERGTIGQRMGGVLDEEGHFAMLAGLVLGANDSCVSGGVGTVLGHFADQAQTVDNGIIRYEWAGGCTIAGVDLGVALRIETDYRAVRTSDFDLSSLPEAAEPPMDDSGEGVDPDAPESGYERPEEG